MNRTSRHIRIIYTTVFTLILPALFLVYPSHTIQAQSGAEEKMKEIKPTRFFKEDKFTYFKDKLSVLFDLKQEESIDKFSGILLKIVSNDKSERIFILDWEKSQPALNLLVLYQNGVRKYTIPVDSSFIITPTAFRFDIDFKSDKISWMIGDRTVDMHKLGFSIHNGYRFSLLPELAFSEKKDGMPLLHTGKLHVYLSPEKETNTIWFWFLAIIIIDLAIFLVIHLHRKNRRKQGEEKTAIVLQQSEPLIQASLPATSAIYVFGRFHVYNQKGEDITKSFSPLLREILCLLILYSKRKGISPDKLKELLWADKSDNSARNNRAVYFGKLRNVLEPLGKLEINNETGYWCLKTEDIFIDYFEYEEVLAKGSWQRSDIERLIAIVSNGNLLPTANYPWMDAFKDEVSNRTIQTLLDFARTIDTSEDPRLIVKLADIVFKFDSLNEQALSLKCKAYAVLGQHASAKTTYNKFCEEYRSMYGNTFSIAFSDLDKIKS